MIPGSHAKQVNKIHQSTGAEHPTSINTPNGGRIIAPMILKISVQVKAILFLFPFLFCFCLVLEKEKGVKFLLLRRV